MTQSEVIQIDEEMQAAKSKEGKYLAFAFLERGPNKKWELEVAGWTEVNAKWDESAVKMIGTVQLWGREIPVKRLETSPGRGTFEMTSTACIVVFERSKPGEGYFGLVVDAISNVMAIAEKDPETVAVIENKIKDTLGGEKTLFSVVEKNQLQKTKQEPTRIVLNGRT